jgi:hypothetical protein
VTKPTQTNETRGRTQQKHSTLVSDELTRTADSSADPSYPDCRAPSDRLKMAGDAEELPLPPFRNQVAGHKGISHEGGSILMLGPGQIAKPVGRGYFAGEDRFYRSLGSYPTIARFCPSYSGTRTFAGREYVVLEDLTHGMQNPLVVDIKMGTCTVAPDAPWTKRITHLAKDRATTTRSLGLRIVGTQTALKGRALVRLGKSWGKSIQPEDMSAALRCCFSCDGRLCTTALATFVPQLRELVRVLEEEPRWRLVSSSLLFVFEADGAGGAGGAGGADCAASPSPPASTVRAAGASSTPHSMRMIDFAHAYPLRCRKDHGYLYGLRNLLRLLSGLLGQEEVGGWEEATVEGESSTARSPGVPSLSLPPVPSGAVSPDGNSAPLSERAPSSSEDKEPAMEMDVVYDLALAPSEAGYSLGNEASSLDARIAEDVDQVRLHPDEFAEALAHSQLGAWCVDWLGYRADLPLSSEGVGASPARSASPRPPFKHIITQCVHSGYSQPRALSLRLGGWPKTPASEPHSPLTATAAPGRCTVKLAPPLQATNPPPADATEDVLLSEGTLHRALGELLAGLSPRASATLLVSFSTQLADLINDMCLGSHFHFASATLWLLYERDSASSASAPALRLSHLTELSMHRHGGCNQSLLAALHALHVALRAEASGGPSPL